jgi:hypothetical protein
MKNIIYIFIFISIIINYYLNSIRLNDISTEYYFWANLHYWLHLIPFAHYLIYRQNKDIFPLVGILGIFLSMSFAVPIFFIHPTSYQLAELSISSMEISFWGYLLFYFVYIFFHNSNLITKNIFDPIKISIENPKIKYSAYLFLGFWFLDSFIKATFIHHLSNLGIYIYIGTFIVLLNNKIRINKIEKYLFYGIITLEYFTRLVDGLIAYVGMLTLFLMIVNYYSSKKVYRIFLLLIPLVFIYYLISPIKNQFREKVWYSDVSVSIIERLVILKDLISEFNEDKGVTDNRSLDLIERENFFWRYSYQASAFSMVIEETPKNIPYWNGDSYKIFSKFIPRFIWPDKPKEDMGTRFGVVYGIIDSHSNTSINTPILTEMYLNYGYKGILIGMILLSIIYVNLNSYFNNIHISNIGKVYSIAIIFPFVIHESNFSLVFGNIPLIILTVYGLIRLYINK